MFFMFACLAPDYLMWAFRAFQIYRVNRLRSEQQKPQSLNPRISERQKTIKAWRMVVPERLADLIK